MFTRVLVSGDPGVGDLLRTCIMPSYALPYEEVWYKKWSHWTMFVFVAEKWNMDHV